MKIIPVIHHKDEALSIKNAQICAKNKVYGIFLISMDGDNVGLSALAKRIKNIFPDLKVGVNHLGYSAIDSIYENLNYSLDMTWSDNPIVTGDNIAFEAQKIATEINDTNHMFFNSVAFKYQKAEKNIEQAVINSKSLNFIPTTSGQATGKAADLGKLSIMKQALKDYPLAIASGLTPENVQDYVNFIEYGLVATGISEDFYTFDEAKLKEIIQNTQ